MSQDNQAPVQVDQNPLLKPSKNATEGTDSFILAKLLAECFFSKNSPCKKSWDAAKFAALIICKLNWLRSVEAVRT